ncbi:MAG: hypothetical protein ACRD04_03675 [Terriglobales bacterium]
MTCLLLAVAPLWAQAPPSNRELLQQAWWTGPMLAPSAATLPRGHLLVEPYFYDVVTSPLSNTAGSLSYIEYGATDRLTVGLIPTFDYEWLPGGSRSTQLELGDFSLVGQYALRSYRLGHWAPALAFNFQESFPTGRYDRLGTHASDGFGAGVHTSMLSLFSQTFFWLPNGRILRARLNLSQSFSSTARVSGVSVYGTGPAFVGTAHPGAVSNADLGLEYSLTQRWVLALDAASRYQNRIQVRGFDPRAVALDSGAGEQVIFAPAVEYNVTSSLGFLCGLRLIEAGHNFTRSVTPAIAVDWAH